MEQIARVKRTVGAVLLALFALAGVMLGSPLHTYADTPVVAGGIAVVTNTDGDSIRIRAGAGTQYERLGLAYQGDIVSVLEGPVKDSADLAWFKVQAPRATGWMMASYLTGKEAQAAPAAPSSPAIQGWAKVANAGGDPVRLRVDPTRHAGTLTSFYEGTTAAVKAGPQADAEGISWYQISANGYTGWMMAQYLVQTDAPPADARQQNPVVSDPPPADQPSAPPASEQVVASSGLGEQAVNLAMQYLGYGYRYGGTSPAGFDCSGFVYYIYQVRLGVPVGRVIPTQIESGVRVSQANLQPGDMVFFANTYKAGLSHAGIYIGNGKFIHAQNESTGVVISSLSSSYWAGKYYGATRP